MTDDDNSSQGNALELDWDDAIEAFGADLDNKARSESAPFPQRTTLDLDGLEEPATDQRPTPFPPASLRPPGAERPS